MAANDEPARRLLPLVNGSGAPDATISEAVRTLVVWGSGDAAFREAARHVREWGSRQSFRDTGALTRLPAEARLALEMAAHEHLERRAMEGELAELQREWRQAEEIASIADDLLLPNGVRHALDRLRASR